MYSSTLFNNLHICTNKSIPNYSTYYTHSANMCVGIHLLICTVCTL